MELWGELGGLWDQAYDGQAAIASARASVLARTAGNDVDRAYFQAMKALCELFLCRFADATRSALEAATVAENARGADGSDARFYAASVRALAAAMLAADDSADSPAPLAIPDLDELRHYAAGIDRRRPERLLLAHPIVEASMASGHFAEVDELVTDLRPFSARDAQFSTLIVPGMDIIFARSLAFRGQLDAVQRASAAVLATPGIAAHPQVTMLVNALLCYVAGQRADRREVEALSVDVLAQARLSVNYVSVGSCLLVSWAFAAIGQIQRAAALLVGASGGSALPRIKTWDRAFGYELLATAALRRGDVASARSWASRAEPLATRPVAAAAVERTLSRVAVATGDHAGGASRASSSMKLDELSGARLDVLRARVLYASALAAAGNRESALKTLTEVATEADELGATSVRKLAAREWRSLGRTMPSPEGGFASLSDREREIAVLVAEGHTNRSIGSTLFLSERTVQTHLSRILSVMGLPSRTAIPAALGTGNADVDVPPLTQRQEEIAKLVAKGYPNANIAKELGISVKTVENHLAGIFTRWQVSSRTAVANVLIARNRVAAK